MLKKNNYTLNKNENTSSNDLYLKELGNNILKRLIKSQLIKSFLHKI